VYIFDLNFEAYMIGMNERNCPKCNGELCYYDSVKRIVKTKNGVAKYVKIRRFKCKLCGSLHRELPNYIFPFKHYENDIVTGVLEGTITSSTLGFEDYPCEMTMCRWLKQEIDKKKK
jgi:hypothetical protein